VSPKQALSFDSKSFLAKEGEGRTLVHYRKDELIFAQGDLADCLFYIQSGTVKLAVNSDKGREAVIAILESTNYFGEGCLAGPKIRMSTATALSDCSILRLAKALVVRLLHEEPAFSEAFVSFLLSRNIRLEGDLVDQLLNSSEKRLARVLLLLANFGKEGNPDLMIPKISQETLADIIGTTRSRVSFFMNKFRKLGFIEYNGEIKVHSSLLNVVLHDSSVSKARLPELFPSGDRPLARCLGCVDRQNCTFSHYCSSSWSENDRRGSTRGEASAECQGLRSVKPMAEGIPA
jgi:CRP/FNR family transcriptional regulator, cyclic AMP receptor protein